MSSAPSPPVNLDDGCSAVFNNTLYTYQWNAFQSIPLSAGGAWTNHTSNGVAVNGSRCVIGNQNGDDVLFVVGGVPAGASSASAQSYTGLQRFSFTEKSWETITSPGPVSVVQNRVSHGAAYLNSTQQIVIYSGWQDGQPVNSSQTFTISTTAPYAMQSYVSNNAPPVVNPILQPWNDSHVYMAGGSPSNQDVWVFSQAGGWQQVDVVLPSSIPNMMDVQASLLDGAANSKVLQLFDMSTTPNTVTSLLVQGESGQPFPQKRAKMLQDRAELNLTNMPQYNGTLAPQSARTGFSLAQTDSGLVVISGGDPSQPLCMFNQTANAWISSQSVFNPSGTTPPPSSTTSPSISQTSTPGAAAGAAAAGSSNTNTIIGAVLGGFFGLIAIAIILLLIFRARRQRRNNRPESDDFLGESKPSGNTIGPRGPSPNPSEASIAKDMISYPVRPQQPYEPILDPNRMTAFPSVFENSASTNSTSVRPVQPTAARNGSRGGRSDEGWSQYFEEGQEVPQTGNNVPRFAAAAPTTAYSAYTASDLHESAEVPPLNVAAAGASGGRVAPPRPPRPEDSDTFLESASSEQEQRGWDPVGTTEQPSWAQRPSSSVYGAENGGLYTGSTTAQHPRERNLIPRFPAVPSSTGRPSFVPPQRGVMASGEFFSPMSSAGTANEPRSAGDASGLGGARRERDDMSWLNLQAQTGSSSQRR